jgi:hypothetical protein
MANGRCRMHGGKSTGPKTEEGRKRISEAHLKHGDYFGAGSWVGSSVIGFLPSNHFSFFTWILCPSTIMMPIEGQMITVG